MVGGITEEMGLEEEEERRGDSDIRLRGRMGETSGLETRLGEAEGVLLKGLGKVERFEGVSFDKAGEGKEVTGEDGGRRGELYIELGVLSCTLGELS